MVKLLLISIIAMTIFVVVYWALRKKTTRKNNDCVQTLTTEQANRRLMSQCDEKQYSLRRFRE